MAILGKTITKSDFPLEMDSDGYTAENHSADVNDNNDDASADNEINDNHNDDNDE